MASFLKAGSNLPQEISMEIQNLTQAHSQIQQIVQQVPLSGNGNAQRVLAQAPEASWVEEAGVKPATAVELGTKLMTPYKITALITVSDEALEDDDMLYEALVNELPKSLGRGFDKKILSGTAPGTGFDVLSDVNEVTMDPKKVYASTVSALRSVNAGKGDITAWVMNQFKEADVLDELDANNRPLYIGNVASEGRVGQLLGRNAYKSTELDADTFAIGGDWASARWGTVSGIDLKVSTDATIDGVSMFQTNQVALLAEQRVGFVVSDKSKFAKISTASAGA